MGGMEKIGDRMKIALGVCCLAIGAFASQMPSAGGVRRTLLVHPDEFTDRWIDRAAAIGLTSLEIHPTGGTNAAASLTALLGDLETSAFRARIDRARAKGLEIGYEFHAAGWLLPRDLFGEHPEYFRMDGDGRRCRDINFCLSSAEGMDLVAKRAVELAGRLYGSSHRYFFWMDDVPDGVCHCEKCRGYSASDQQLLFVNRVLAELRKTIPDARLCYLAYLGGINPPEKVTPSEGVFLEYAPIKRDPSRPLAVQDNADVAPLKALVAKFGARDARVLEYWFDNSLLSKWTKPPKRFVPPADVVREDLAYYRALGFSDLASFACFLGDDYEKLWGEPDVTPFARGFHSSVGGFDRTDFTWTIGGGRFRFAFTVRDATVSPVRGFKTKRDLERGDRVEVFFCPTADMKTAYRCAEIDPLGRVLDYACVFPRQFDYDWSFKTLVCRTARTTDGYTVEGSVSVDELRGLGIDLSHFWLGAFRGDFDENENLVAWYSQLPPGPGEADFHRPCMVGEVAVGRWQ